MATDHRKFDVPFRAATEEDDGAVELSLGLSIGGSSRRMGGSGAAPLMRETGSGGWEAYRRGSGASMPSSAQTPLPGFQQGDLADDLDTQRRRAIHAMRRRQEALKKRREKQHKKGPACGGRDDAGLCGSSPSAEGACWVDDRVALEAQEKQWRVRDREAREEEVRHSERRAGENHELGSNFVSDPEICSNANANPSAGANHNPSISPNFSNPNFPPFGVHPFPVMTMQYPYPHVQYVPMANGFGFPYMMPCWAPAMSMPSVAGGPNPASNVFQPLACRTFQPFSPPDVEPSSGLSPLSGKVVDLTGENGTRIKQAPSGTDSLGTNSSSAISDHQSNSIQGESSGNDIRSHSSRAPAETSHPQLSPQASNLVQGQSEHSISSPHVEPEVDAVEAPSEKKRPSPNSAESESKGDPNSAKIDGMVSLNKTAPAADESDPPPLPSSLPRMPCVSTTGNGPNGKTITGFLYRYTSTEVSIVCVCHGSSLSPAEFVKHAGGTDIDNPLKHIIVVPS